MASRVRIESPQEPARLVCAVDVAYEDNMASAAAVVWDVSRSSSVEERAMLRRAEFPYISGLLSFREIPPLLAVLDELDGAPDAILCDGHGLAHPRRFGLACHLGVLLDLPTVGCAKRPLWGHFEEPAATRGASEPVMDRGEMVGRVVCTRSGCRPVFVSPGHKTGPLYAEELVLACSGEHRIPEPLREADSLARRALRELG